MALLSQRVQAIPPSGIRRFFDIAATMKDVISLGIGEPDFVTPDMIREAGIRSIQDGYTAYTSNSGLLELRQALAALELPQAEQEVRRMVAEYDRRRRVIVDAFNRIGLPTFEPQGAFYAFPRVDHLGVSSAEFAERLLTEQHVAVIPGEAFGSSGQGFVRACYATSMDNIEAALDRIEKFVSVLA
jgi:aspartate/methionine/tyrosine aminotransferase